MEEQNKDTAKKNRAKIIVASEDELTDLLRKISALNDENILLTFAENSDLLVSPINLKVLQEVCDDLKKNTILQIIQNPTGLRNAKVAGIITTKSPSDVDDDLWLIAKERRIERQDKKEALLKASRTGENGIQEVMESLGEKTMTPVIQDSEYQKRVQEVIAKSKGLVDNENKKIIQDDDLTFAIGQDIDDEVQGNLVAPTKKTNMLVGRNFNNISELKKIDDKGRIAKPAPKPKKEEKVEDDIKKSEKVEKNPKKPADKKKLKKKIILATVILLATLGISGAFAYYTIPTVNVEVYIESKSIEVEKILKGSPDITEINLDAGEIPVKREEIIVSRSDHANTTGTGIRGEKAEGIVSLKYWEGDDTTVPAGTMISSDGLEFEITRSVEIPEAPSTTQGVPVRAIEPGSDHNLSAGNIFSVSGFGENLTAENRSSFSGGLSEEYPMLTQEDYDKLKKELTDDAFEDGMRQLKERNPGWELLEDSVKQELDGEVNTDIPVGSEGHLFNMSLTTKTVAIYYNKEEILESRQEIITKSALEKNLFSAEDDLDLELDEDIETNITVKNIEGSNITVEFTAKGYVRVNVDIGEIQEKLLDKSWEEGKKFLENTDFADKSPKIEFYPEYFPRFLWHFPSNANRVVIETELVETEVIRDEDSEDNDEDTE